MLIASIFKPLSRMQKHFATIHETARKNVERAFGVLQSTLRILVDTVASGLGGANETIHKMCNYLSQYGTREA